MTTAIVYYSQHHSNTKKLLDAIKAADSTVELIDVTSPSTTDLSSFDRIGFASGIYYTSFAKQVLTFAETYLPEGKGVFFIYTHGAPKGGFLKAIRSVTEKKHCWELGSYHCLGYDTFGPFKLVGGIAKEHPTGDEINGAVEFYKKL